MTCPDCHGPMELAEHPEWTYPSGCPRKYYRCLDRLFCTGSHGAHPDGTPFGVPGDYETRAARGRAHDALDHLAGCRSLSRGQVYLWLRSAMRMAKDDAHVGRFDAGQCAAVVRLVHEAVGSDRTINTI